MSYRDKWFEFNESADDTYTCVRCGKTFSKGDIDIDHIIPQSKGGKDHLTNLQCMCVYCNRSKGNDTSRTIPDFIGNTVKYAKRKNDIRKAGNELLRGEFDFDEDK